jgi:hypothetical protein
VLQIGKRTAAIPKACYVTPFVDQVEADRLPDQIVLVTSRSLGVGEKL